MYIECTVISNKPDTYSFQIETIADIILTNYEVQFYVQFTTEHPSIKHS